MAKSKPYFANNWRAIKEAPAEHFESIEFDEFMDWKIGGWELPSSVHCIIRERHLGTNEFKEYVYQKPMAAKKKLEERMSTGEPLEFTVVDSSTVHFLIPEMYDGEEY